MIFFGTQPTLTQVPPISPASITAHLAPYRDSIKDMIIGRSLYKKKERKIQASNMRVEVINAGLMDHLPEAEVVKWSSANRIEALGNSAYFMDKTVESAKFKDYVPHLASRIQNLETDNEKTDVLLSEVTVTDTGFVKRINELNRMINIIRDPESSPIAVYTKVYPRYFRELEKLIFKSDMWPEFKRDNPEYANRFERSVEGIKLKTKELRDE